MSKHFVLAKVTAHDIVFLGEEEAEETRYLGDAKLFNSDETNNFSFISVETARQLIKQKIVADA